MINRPTGAIANFNVIIKIRKYTRFYKRHHFIPMAMEVHDTPKRDIDCFIRECASLFHNRQSRDHLFLSFCIQFFRQHVNIAF